MIDSRELESMHYSDSAQPKEIWRLDNVYRLKGNQ
jgi:hypothetical protein